MQTVNNTRPNDDNFDYDGDNNNDNIRGWACVVLSCGLAADWARVPTEDWRERWRVVSNG